MKCAPCQRRLLCTENPRQPSPTVEAHLEDCTVCQDFQQRLLQLEANVARVPVPPSRAGQELIGRLLNAVPGPFSLPLSAPKPSRSRNRNPWLVPAAAAAVVLIACGAWLGSWLWDQVGGPGKAPRVAHKQAGPGNGPTEPLSARLVQCDLRLSQARNPQERVEILAELAGTLQGETPVLARAAGTQELDHLAGLYGKVIRQGLVARSRALPMPERRRILTPIVAQLARASREAEQLAQAQPRAARALRLVASAAREGEIDLIQLMEGDA